MSAACHEPAPSRPKGPVEDDGRRAGALTIALVGRPNAGKSSLFNVLTGGDAHVGNFPGITVDILEGRVDLPSGARATIADLPGLYSIEATIDASTDEGVARSFLDRVRSDGRAHVIVQVADPTRLALALRLTREIARTGAPFVLVLTHADVLRAEGRAVDARALSEAIGGPVVLVDCREERAKRAVLAAVEDRERDAPRGVVSRVDFDPVEVAREVTTDVASEAERRRRTLTARLDAVLLHPVVGPVLFVGLMALLFAAVFLVADPATSAMDKLVGLSRSALVRLLGKNLASSFLADGVLGGAGTVLAFMPQIVILTIALELLEASGYLARGAFLVDRLLRLLGLSGRSFLPLLMGHACAVPAISATRIVRDPRERLTTILVLPLMTCSARLPTYGLVIATFFARESALFRSGLFVSLYFTGILTALVASFVLRRTATRGKSLPLVLEMPAYRLPQARLVGRKAWQASVRFLRDVGTIIVAVSAVLWVLLTVPAPGATREGPPIESSVAASIGRTIEPVTRPAGFDWRIDVGLIGSFGAREVMVGTMGVIFGIENAADDPAPLTERLREAKKPDGSPLYGVPTGLAILAFFALACQCMSTVAAIRRETKSWRWPAFVLGYTYALGWAAAVVVYQVSTLLGLR
jgi:ferrous iron transport protein B